MTRKNGPVALVLLLAGLVAVLQPAAAFASDVSESQEEYQRSHMREMTGLVGLLVAAVVGIEGATTYFTGKPTTVRIIDAIRGNQPADAPRRAASPVNPAALAQSDRPRDLLLPSRTQRPTSSARRPRPTHQKPRYTLPAR